MQLNRICLTNRRSAMWLLVGISVCGAVAAMGMHSQPDSKSPKVVPPVRIEAKVTFQVHHSSFGSVPSGLIIAGWDDGTVVFAMDPNKPGKELQAGTISADQLKRVIEDLKSAGFFEEHKNPGLAPDMSYTRMNASHEGEARMHQWHESLNRTWGAHVQAEPSYYKFAKMWAVSRTALMFAAPEKYEPIAKVPAARKKLDAAVAAGSLRR